MTDVPIPTTTKPAAAIEIRTAAKDKLKGIGGELRDRIVDGLVEAEKGRRLEILTKAFQAREATAKTLNGIKPDAVTVNPESGERTANYQDATWKRRQKTEEALSKLDAAIEACLGDDATNDEWAKLEKATNAASSGGGGEKKDG